MKIIIAFIGLLSCLFFSQAQALNSVKEPTHQKININTADASTLTNSVKGIGAKRAESIVKYRDSHKGFKSLSDLTKVPGLGKNFVKTHQKAIEDTFVLQ